MLTIFTNPWPDVEDAKSLNKPATDVSLSDILSQYDCGYGKSMSEFLPHKFMICVSAASCNSSDLPTTCQDKYISLHTLYIHSYRTQLREALE